MKQNLTSELAPTSNLPTNDVPIRILGGVIVIITFVIFGGWAYLAPIDSSALAPGTVTVKSYKKTVQHLYGGLVESLVVKEGDNVVKGQVLLTLDDSETKASLEIIRGQYITLLAQVARLTAERNQRAKIHFPMELNSTDPRVLEAKHTEADFFAIRKNNYIGEVAVLKQRISQISARIVGIEQQIQYKQNLQSSYSKEQGDIQELLAEGFADRNRLREVERRYTQVRADISGLRSEISTSKIQQGESKLQILQLQKNIQQEVTGQLTEAKAQLFDLKERMAATEDKLSRVDVKAPASGRVLGLSMHTIGGVIMAGHPILEIVPQDAGLIIEAQVSPMDIDRVQIGLTAEVRFSAFKQAKTPVMNGQVINLSPDIFQDERTGMSYYQARVELTQESEAKLGEMQLLPGMPAEVLINTGERTVFEYLAQPITNAFARAFIED